MKKLGKKRKLRPAIMMLCFLLLFTTMAQPVEAKKFDAAAAKKKVTVTYKKLPNGILAIYKNKNSAALKLTATIRFRDGDKKELSKLTQKNLCLAGKSTAAFFFQAPRDEYGNVVSYSSYKASFSIAKSKYKSSAKKISISSELETIEGKFAAVNLGTKTLSNIHATIVFYDGDGNILGCSTKYLSCYKKNSIEQFSISYVGESWQPSKAKVYIDWAY